MAPAVCHHTITSLVEQTEMDGTDRERIKVITTTREEERDQTHAISLFKFQEEKKSLSRSLDEEIVFDIREKGDGGEESRSCISTTPTSNSWTVAVEELNQGECIQNVGRDKNDVCRELILPSSLREEEEEQELDRKPPAIDKFSPPQEENRANQQLPAMPSEAVLAAASLPSAHRTVSSKKLSQYQGPPPLISLNQQRLLSLALSGHHQQKKVPSIENQKLAAASPRSASHHQIENKKSDASQQIPLLVSSKGQPQTGIQYAGSVSTSLEQIEQEKADGGPPISPRKAPLLCRQAGNLNVAKLKAPPCIPRQSVRSMTKAKSQLNISQHKAPVPSHMAIQRQVGSHNLKQGKTNIPSQIVPLRLPRRPGAPFPVSEETKRLAAHANRIEREKREKQRALQYKLKLQHQQQERHQRQEDSQPPGEIDQSSGTVSPSLLPPVRRQRRHTIMEANMSSIANADPAFRTFVSEPNASVASRHSICSLAEKRKSLQQRNSLRVAQHTASFRSNRTGISSVTMEPDVTSSVMRGLQRPTAWGQGRTPFPRLSIKDVTLDNPTSVHSSVGYNPDSVRSILDNPVDGNLMEGSAHGNILQNIKQSNGYHCYNPQLKPHLEGDSISTANQSSGSLDASTKINPPNPEDFRRKLSERRRSIQPVQPGARAISQYSAPSSTGVTEDQDVGSQASTSKLSLGNRHRVRRLSRNSNSSAGLRLIPPSSDSLGDGKELNTGRRPDQIAFPLPRTLESGRPKTKKEAGASRSELWNSILEDQQDIIMELACKVSQKENKIAVHEKQQARRCHEDGALFSMSKSPLHGSQIPLQALFHEQELSFQEMTDSWNDPALEMALKLSRQDQRPGPEFIDGERELELAVQQSREESSAQQDVFGADASLDLALAISQRETRLAPMAPLESSDTRTMEVAMALSNREYEFEVSRRQPADVAAAADTMRHSPGSVPSMQMSNRQGSILSYSDTNIGTGNRGSLVMPPEMIEHDGPVPSSWEVALQQSGGGQEVAPRRVADGALELAIALSRMDTKTDAVPSSKDFTKTSTVERPWSDGDARSIELAKELSYNESSLYAMELSRRAPDAQQMESSPGRAVRSHFQSRQNWFEDNVNARSSSSSRNMNCNRRTPVPNDDDESALRLAMELSYQDAYGTSMNRDSASGEDSLELAVALSRNAAYGDGY